MRAIQLSAPGILTAIERDIPPTAVGHALVRIDLVGLCGSDASYFARGVNGDFVVAEPLILGHEVIGIVAAIDAKGPGTPRVGDRVAVHPAWPSPRRGESAVAADLPSWRSRPRWCCTHSAGRATSAVRRRSSAAQDRSDC